MGTCFPIVSEFPLKHWNILRRFTDLRVFKNQNLRVRVNYVSPQDQFPLHRPQQFVGHQNYRQ